MGGNRERVRLELEDKGVGTEREGREIGEKTWELKEKRARTEREEDENLEKGDRKKAETRIKWDW